MTSVPRQSDVPGEPPRELVFTGHTGVGRDVEIHAVGDWLDITFIDGGGDRRGFSLNPLYTGHLARALVDLLANRASEHRRSTADGGL